MRSLISGPLSRNENEVTLEELVNQNGDWKWEILSFTLPIDIRHRFQAIHVDTSSPIADNTSWIGNVNGSFTTKFAYSVLCSSKFLWPEDSNWSWVWKLGCHPRYKLFIWLVLMNGLPTRGNLARRGMNIPSNCPICNLNVEENSHLFRDCVVTQQIFENSNFSAASIVFLAKGKAGKFAFLASKSDRGQNPPTQGIQVKWNPPPPNWAKLNTDGSCLTSTSDIGAGGILRDHLGKWVRGFSIFKGHGNSVMAELWAIYHGLRLASQIHIYSIIVDTDSLVVVNMLKDQKLDSNHHLFPLIRNCRSILSRFERSKIQHVHREGNYCADCLAKKASTTKYNLVSIQHALPEMYPLILADCLGIESSRKTGIGLFVLNSVCPLLDLF
ncbi:LINE-type retrotransposon LIb DNA [Senna tora]|uniref:LINE-type retrotransposon LIb DNA n=1 Tax=Senna tora TaxID=362788 RepID=A0A834TYE4_9FABA|nr:LINE-type retrotransposon LIb DNA [Senna tora]